MACRQLHLLSILVTFLFFACGDDEDEAPRQSSSATNSGAVDASVSDSATDATAGRDLDVAQQSDANDVSADPIEDVGLDTAEDTTYTVLDLSFDDGGVIDDRPRLTEIECDDEMFLCCEDVGEAFGRVVRDGIPCLEEELAGLAPGDRGPMVEYRCVDENGQYLGDRNRIEARYGWPGCNGVSPTCSFEFEHIVWDDEGWELSKSCDCSDSSYSPPSCLVPDDHDDRVWPDADERCLKPEGDRYEGYPRGRVACERDPTGSPIGDEVEICYTGGTLHRRWATETAHCNPDNQCVGGFLTSSVATIQRNFLIEEFLEPAGNCYSESPDSPLACRTLRQHTPETVSLPIRSTQAYCGNITGYLPPCHAGEVCCDDTIERILPRGAPCGEVYPDRNENRCLGEQIVELEHTVGYCQTLTYWDPQCVSGQVFNWSYLDQMYCISDLECPIGMICDGAGGCVFELPCEVTEDCPVSMHCGRDYCEPDRCRGDDECESGDCEYWYVSDPISGQYGCIHPLRGNRRSESAPPNPDPCGDGEVCNPDMSCVDDFCRLPENSTWAAYISGAVRAIGVVEDCEETGRICAVHLDGPYCYDSNACDEGTCCDEETGQKREEGEICEGEDPDDPPIQQFYCTDDFTFEEHSILFRCDGRAPDCRSQRTIVSTTTCPDDQRCFDDGNSVGCHTPGELCEPDDRCCLGFGVPAPGRRCSTRTLAIDVWCDETLWDTQYRYRKYHLGCDDDLRCSSDPEDWTSSTGIGWCGHDRVCEVRDDGSEGCSAEIEPGPCLSGVCCDLDSGEPRPWGTPCPGSVPNETEVRCGSDGGTIEFRVYGPACDGEAYICGGPTDLATYSEWETIEVCSEDATCVNEGDGPVCVVGDRPCDGGACCSGEGTLRGLGEQCYPGGIGSHVVAGSEDYCEDDWVWRSYLTWACDGSSADCPQSFDYRTERTRTGLAYCEYGCSYDSGAPACREQPIGGEGQCGTTCLISATCGDGVRCLSGRCLPDDCASCAGQACVYNGDSCAFLGCESGSDSCSGESSLLRRTNFYAAGVLLDSMEVDYGWVRIFEPILNLSYRYFPASGDQWLPYDTTIYLTVRDAAGNTWYVRSDPLRPAPGEWAYNVSEAAGWNNTLCSGLGTSSACLGEAETRTVFSAGICVTGFVIAQY